MRNTTLRQLRRAGLGAASDCVGDYEAAQRAYRGALERLEGLEAGAPFLARVRINAAMSDQSALVADKGLHSNFFEPSELAHAVAALVFIGFALGHMYLGTIGTEGTLEGMVTGSVDRNWAATHHDKWLEEMDRSAGARSHDDHRTA